MDNVSHFLFAYEEWELKWNSLPPEYIFSSILDHIVSSPVPFKGWIYEYNGCTGCLGIFARLLTFNKYNRVLSSERYVLVRSFSNNEKKEYVKAFMEYINTGNIMYIIKTGNICSVKQLLSGCFLDDSDSGYRIISNGTIKNNLKSKVFTDTVELDDWVQIKNSDVLLIVWGEGTVVFTLKNVKNKEI